jgi:hypothetical protein
MLWGITIESAKKKQQSIGHLRVVIELRCKLLGCNSKIA